MTPTRVDRNVEQARGRVAAFFEQPSAAVLVHDRDQAGASVDDYLARSTTSVPPDVRSLMVDLHALTPQVARAMPFGRGNAFVRDGTGRLDERRSGEKANLKFLGEKTQEAVEQTVSSRERELQKSARTLASGILTGAGSCNHYAELYAVAIAAYVAGKPALKDRLKVEFLARPRIEGVDEGRVDHRSLRATYTDDAGGLHALSCDAYVDEPKVPLESDSALSGAFASSTGHLSTASAVSGMKDLVLAHLKKLNEEMPAVAGSEAYRYQSDGNRAIVDRDFDAKRSYGLGRDLEGWLDAPLSTTKAHVGSPTVRRNSLQDPGESPLIADE